MSKINGYVVCIDNCDGDYAADLIIGKIYRTIEDKRAKKDDLIRVIDESGEDYLFPAEFFVPIKLPKTVEKLF